MFRHNGGGGSNVAPERSTNDTLCFTTTSCVGDTSVALLLSGCLCILYISHFNDWVGNGNMVQYV